MYIKVENDKLSWCKKPYKDYEFVDIDYETFDVGKYKIINGALVDISNTEEYRKVAEKKAKEIQIEEYKKQLEELDKKRIRALAEPELMDENTTWLEYYNSRIKELRQKIN